MVERARAGLARLAADDAYAAGLAGATIVDVRTTEQQERDGRIPGALEVSLNVLEWRLDPDSAERDPRAPDLDDQVIVICAEGWCSSLAAGRLQELGFRRATDVVEGFRGWVAAGLPTVGGPARPATRGPVA